MKMSDEKHRVGHGGLVQWLARDNNNHINVVTPTSMTMEEVMIAMTLSWFRQQICHRVGV
jgi:hypothetical protein